MQIEVQLVEAENPVWKAMAFEVAKFLRANRMAAQKLGLKQRYQKN